MAFLSGCARCSWAKALVVPQLGGRATARGPAIDPDGVYN